MDTEITWEDAFWVGWFVTDNVIAATNEHDREFWYQRFVIWSAIQQQLKMLPVSYETAAPTWKIWSSR